MKKTIALLLAVVFVLSFTACKKPAEPDHTPVPTEQQAEAPTPEATEATTSAPTTAPTEATTSAPSAVPTEIPGETPIPSAPESYDEHDAAVLREFFESKGYTPEINGDKLFPYYSRNDPSTWTDNLPDRNKAVFWNESGKVTGINLIVNDSAEDDDEDEATNIILYGNLDLSDLDKLERIMMRDVEVDKLSMIDPPELMRYNGLSMTVSANEVIITTDHVKEMEIRTWTHLFCDITGNSGTGEDPLPSFLVEVTHEGLGYVDLHAYEDGDGYYAKLWAPSHNFIGWFDSEGNLVSSKNKLELFGGDTGVSAIGNHVEFRYTAKFKEEAEPTQAPTPAPTEIPADYTDFIEIPFEDCAELIMNVVPGDGDDELTYYRAEDDWEEDGAPDKFYFDGSKVYVADGWGKLFVFDVETGETCHVDFMMPSYELSDFIIRDGLMISGHTVYNFETGEKSDLLPIMKVTEEGSDFVRIFIEDGKVKCYAVTKERPLSSFSEIDYAYKTVTEFELDLDILAWKGVRDVYTRRPTHELSYWGLPKWRMTFAETGIEIPSGQYLGTDDEGNIYMVCTEIHDPSLDNEWYYWYYICKYSPNGYPLCRTLVPYTSNEFIAEPKFIRCEDGAVYFSMPLSDSFLVYRVTL